MVLKKFVVMKLQHEKLVNMQYFIFRNCKRVFVNEKLCRGIRRFVNRYGMRNCLEVLENLLMRNCLEILENSSVGSA